MSDGNKRTIIEEGTEFDGSIHSKRSITVSGVVKGELRAPSVTVTASGRIDAHVQVEELISEGDLSGDIHARTVELSGKVSDRTVIDAETLEVKLPDPDQIVRVAFGTCELRVGEPGTNRDRKPAPTETEAMKLESESPF